MEELSGKRNTWMHRGENIAKENAKVCNSKDGCGDR